MSSLEIIIDLPNEIWALVVAFIDDDAIRDFASLSRVSTALRGVVRAEIDRRCRRFRRHLHVYDTLGEAYGIQYNPLRELAIVRYLTPHESVYPEAILLITVATECFDSAAEEGRFEEELVEQCNLRCMFIRRSRIARNTYRNLLWWFPEHGQGIALETGPSFRHFAKVSMIYPMRSSSSSSTLPWAEDVLGLLVELLTSLHRAVRSLPFLTVIDDSSIYIELELEERNRRAFADALLRPLVMLNVSLAYYISYVGSKFVGGIVVH